MLAHAVHILQKEKRKSMKHWRVDFSIKYRRGEVAVEEVTLEIDGENITIALGKAIQHINQVREEDQGKIDQIVIWDIGMIEDDVF